MSNVSILHITLNYSSLLTPETGSPMMRHNPPKPDLVQLKTVREDSPLHRCSPANTTAANITVVPCPVHSIKDDDLRCNTLNHAREVCRRVTGDFPSPSCKKPELREPLAHYRRSAGSQSLPQSVSFPVEKNGTMRYVTTAVTSQKVGDKSRQSCTT